MKSPSKLFMSIAAIASLVGCNSSEQKDEVSGNQVAQTISHRSSRVIDCDVGSVIYRNGNDASRVTTPNTENGQETIRQICIKNGITPGF